MLELFDSKLIKRKYRDNLKTIKDSTETLISPEVFEKVLNDIIGFSYKISSITDRGFKIKLKSNDDIKDTLKVVKSILQEHYAIDHVNSIFNFIIMDRQIIFIKKIH